MHVWGKLVSIEDCMDDAIRTIKEMDKELAMVLKKTGEVYVYGPPEEKATSEEIAKAYRVTYPSLYSQMKDLIERIEPMSMLDVEEVLGTTVANQIRATRTE